MGVFISLYSFEKKIIELTKDLKLDDATSLISMTNPTANPTTNPITNPENITETKTLKSQQTKLTPENIRQIKSVVQTPVMRVLKSTGIDSLTNQLNSIAKANIQ